MHATHSRSATMQPEPPLQPFAAWSPTWGCWQTSQIDLFGHLAPYSVIWPTSGTTHDGLAYRHLWPVLHIIGSGCSSSRIPKRDC
ncbi:hypothetical protein AB0O26_11570 [Micrococcus luteus]|uniref:hypothetical protein n=1 Tax=Micrococcus luteus TaxID=1270 RepID=UPI0021B2A806|nr:hypothetical protein [Micrococcus luteus]